MFIYILYSVGYWCSFERALDIKYVRNSPPEQQLLCPEELNRANLVIFMKHALLIISIQCSRA